MTSEPDTKPEGTELAEFGRRRRGRPAGRRDSQPRKTTVHSAYKIIRAASKAGYGSLTIDTDGKITLQKGRPADQASQERAGAGQAGGSAGDDDKGEKEWDAKRQEWLDRAGQD